MSLANSLDRILRRNLRLHVAWLPVTTPYALGDYGYRRGGVFEALGNLREFGVEVEPVTGRSTSLDFVSSDATSIRKLAGVTVDVLPDTDAEAELHVTFERKQSLLIKAPQLVSARIGNLAAIGKALTRAQRADGTKWSSSYRVVSELLIGHDVTLLSTRRANATVVLSGRARLLRRLEAGAGSAGITVENAETLGLSLMGKQGPVALDLVRFGWGGRPRGAGDDGQEGLVAQSASWEDEDGDEDDL
ncbi:MAG: hypothetical protein KDK70_39675 [Myxococcales bacterium]|nr:hypothetical protein [Myxococcales bacterium]